MQNNLQEEIDQKGHGLCVLLYADKMGRFGTYLPLAKAISKEGYHYFLIVSSDILPSEQELEGYEDVLIRRIGDGKYLNKLNNVDVFFGSENAIQFAPKNSSIVTLPHSLSEKWFMPSLKENSKNCSLVMYVKRLIRSIINGHLETCYAAIIGRKIVFSRYADYIIIPVKESFESKRTISQYEDAIQEIFPPVFLAGRRDYLDIVMGGYPKIDYFDGMLNKSQENTLQNYKSIVLCSTRIKADSEIANIEAIIRRLLDAFKDYKVIFRPYPGDGHKASRLSELLSHNERFIVDNTLTGVYYLKEACVVIINSATSVAISFSLSTGRPTVHFNKDLDENSKITISNLGYEVANIKDVVYAVSESLTKKDYWYKRIIHYRNNILSNPGFASSYLAKKVPVFASKKSEPGWLSIYRKPWLGFDDPKGVKAHVDKLMRRSAKNKNVIHEIEAYISEQK